MKNLAHELKPLFVEATQTAFPDLALDALINMIQLDEPRDASHGDFACSVPFKLAKELGQNPAQIARQIIDAFPKDFRVGEVSFAPPGFINLRLSVPFLEESLKELEQGVHVEHANEVEGEHSRPVIVEYPSTNAAKHMGAHHIITTVLGDTIANLFEYMGHEVIRINHLGDWGTHFGKLIYAVETWGDEATIHANPTEELTRLYVKFNEEAEKNPELDDEARAIFKALEDGDELRKAMWHWIVQESIEELNGILKRLGIEVDHHMGESFYLKMADEVLEDGKQKGAFVEGEKGALIFDMGEDQTPALIQKSDGTTLYLTRDVATVKYRVDTWHPAEILYVVDHAQSLHFKQDFAVCKALGYTGQDDAYGETKLEHIAFGRMAFADGAMSTRKGNVIKLMDLLDESVKRAGKLATERGTELPRAELAANLEIIGTSALKYVILAQDRNKDIIFDWDKIITLEGNSAPYLLYAYARAKSIVDKVGECPLEGLPTLTEEAELGLQRLLLKFPNVLEKALHDRKPHGICTYLFELCQQFNRFYENCHIAGADTETEKRSRLGLVHAFMNVQRAGLSILGIPVVERV